MVFPNALDCVVIQLIQQSKNSLLTLFYSKSIELLFFNLIISNCFIEMDTIR